MLPESLAAEASPNATVCNSNASKCVWQPGSPYLHPEGRVREGKGRKDTIKGERKRGMRNKWEICLYQPTKVTYVFQTSDATKIRTFEGFANLQRFLNIRNPLYGRCTT